MTIINPKKTRSGATCRPQTLLRTQKPHCRPILTVAQNSHGHSSFVVNKEHALRSAGQGQNPLNKYPYPKGKTLHLTLNLTLDSLGHSSISVNEEDTLGRDGQGQKSSGAVGSLLRRFAWVGAD